jgi:3',5'-cyclic AMP phosphodiesterase CpdA
MGVRANTPEVGQAGALPLARLHEPRGPSTTLAVIADPHVTPDGEGTWKCYDRTEQRLERAVRDINGRAVDAAVIAGDLTRDGHAAEFDAVERLLGGLAVPWVAVPGNHDVAKDHDEHDTPSLLEFVRRFTPGSLPFVERVPAGSGATGTSGFAPRDRSRNGDGEVGGVEVVGINTASLPDGSLAGTHCGGVAPSTLDWLDRTLERCHCPIVVSHHTVGRGEDHTYAGMRTEEYRLEGADALAEVLERHDVALSLSGHIHWPTAAPVGAGHELVMPPLSSFPAAYALVHVAPTGTRVELVPVAHDEELRAAYEAARAHPRGQKLTATAEAGYFERFPLVDTMRDPGW